MLYCRKSCLGSGGGGGRLPASKAWCSCVLPQDVHTLACWLTSSQPLSHSILLLTATTTALQPVYKMAREQGLHVHQPADIKTWQVMLCCTFVSEEELALMLLQVPLARSGKPFDLGVVVSFGYFVPPH